MKIIDKVVKNINEIREPKQKDVYYSEDTKKYYIVAFIGVNKQGETEYNLYDLKSACMAYYNNLSLETLKEAIIKFDYRLVNNSKFIIEGEIN